MNCTMSNHPLISKQKAKLRNAFLSAKSINKQLKLFQEMEKVFQESELAFECWTLSRQLVEQGRLFEQALSFGKRALTIFITNENTNTHCLGKAFSGFTLHIGLDGIRCSRYHKSSLYIAHICSLLASACCELKRHNESLSYLNWANRNLSKLEKDEDNSCNCFLNTSIVTQNILFTVKLDMGKVEEAMIHFRKSLDIRQSMVGESRDELVESYELVLGTYLELMDYKEALPFCLKVMEIYAKRRNFLKVGIMTRHLSFIYNELGEFEKALEQNQLLMIMVHPDSHELLHFESERGYVLIGLGNYEEAIDVLRRVVSHADTARETQASALFTMARAFCCLEKFADAEKYIRAALGYTEKMELDINVAIRFRNMSSMSKMYEKIDEFGIAISLLGTALTISEIPRKILAEGSARLFSLISLFGKEDMGIRYMEDVVEKLEEKFGAEDYEVAHGYRNLGAAYLKSGREELAVKFMVKAKDIMDVALGPHHLDSLKTSQALAETYATFGRYVLAVEIQEKTVNGLQFLEPCEQESLDEAVKLLNKMKKRVAEFPTKISLQSNDDKDLLEKISKCGISDDGKLKYPAPGAPELAKKVKNLLNEAGFKRVHEDKKRGLDHGAWVPETGL